MNARPVKYRATTRHFPCPVCRKDHGCRVFDDGKVWCLRVLSDSDTPVGYRFLGPLRGGLGGSVVPCHDTRPSHSTRKVLPFREPPKRRSPLPASERDGVIRKVSEMCGISDRDRGYLRDVRGLSHEAIAWGLYFSLTSRQRLKEPITPKFPGVSVSGDRFFNTYGGIAGALFDECGYAVGLQLRVMDDAVSGKYRWVGGNNTRYSAHLGNGELPLTYIRPQRVLHPNPVLVEGTIFKPQLASERLGQIVIGASGGQHAGSSSHLRRYLHAALKTTGCSLRVDICPDAGDVQNRHVMQRLGNLEALLRSWQFEVNVLWWGQTTKDHNDIDELQKEVDIAAISWREFLVIAERRGL